MAEKPEPRFALTVIDLALAGAGAASVVAGLTGSAASRAACLATFGAALLMFAGSLIQYGEEQQRLIDDFLHVDENPVTNLIRGPGAGRLLMILGLLMIGTAFKTS
jgi:hypothetical protein